jgi:hypothetical protein
MGDALMIWFYCENCGAQGQMKDGDKCPNCGGVITEMGNFNKKPSEMVEAAFDRMVAAIKEQMGEPVKECGKTIDCEDCEEAEDCQTKWDYIDCDGDCRYCNNDDCRDR